ncbi:MAG: gliding motility-associated C-terminal domain-containing protein [Bacteroidales bacterium]|nr:gliding motility-associated C-terminal domain-containing protein [Bacteroidales bacterium]
MRYFTFILALFLSVFSAYPTHNRAGEITYKQISDLTFEITITTFTYVLSQADRSQLEVEWGDNSISIAPRDPNQTVYLPNYYKKNIYIKTHTYPGPGIYKIVVQDPNRNFGILNIPNSVNVVFSISTILMVNPALGSNDTPILLNPPYDNAALGHKFIHNPGAFDPDGDSLSYNLTVCTKEDGVPIENYTLPPASNEIYVDPVSGDFVWDSPIHLGTYNVAIEINEWRKGYKIGIVVRDMQLEVYETDNNPPVIDPLGVYCVEAGDTVEFDVMATDVDGDIISLFATSGIFTLIDCLASFDSVSASPGESISHFRWITCHESVRDQPYDVLFKAEDNNPELELFDLDNMNIKVSGPSPVLTSITPEGVFIRLLWEDYPTDVITGFNIYRRENPTGFIPDTCTNGVPESLGFELIDFIEGASSNFYVDTNDGEGLESGVQYTYIIVALYPSDAESKASNELTSTLISGVPLITNVSVTETDPVNGKIFVSWKKPGQLDTIPGAAGPYEYLIYRSDDIIGDNYQLISSIQTSDLNDTTFVDSLIATSDNGFIYQIELYNNGAGNRFLIGDPGVASSPFLTLSPGDRKAFLSIDLNVPWVNYRYDIFRWNDVTSIYDSIGITALIEFTDTYLVNGKEYCYKVRSAGEYMSAGLPSGLINLSQESCVTPYDNEPPCIPVLTVSTNCDSLYNFLSWTLESDECYEDVEGYNVFFKETFDENLLLHITFDNRDIFTYKHEGVVAGCYSVSAFDNAGNESEQSNMVCVDSCNFYEIPNVFTPNGDGKNDILRANTSGLVEDVDFKLFNRTGILIFETDEPKLNWNGTYKGSLVPPGVYFYQCDVYEMRITGLELFHLSGFIHVITEKGATPVKFEY